ncbi:CII family transcriptional regulator [Erwinia aphidicola]|uniref:CII family transcriptional regulator n=1 Tax=Erwinia aphidicola TaxID=68334 RepID=UPI0030D1D987
MDHANYSKPTQREIDRAETDLLLTISTLTGRKFAELADCHETKISRTDWRFIAKVFCIARMAAEVSPIGRAMQDFYRAVGNKKAPALTEADSQITIEF